MSSVAQFTPNLVAGGTIRPFRFVKMHTTDGQGVEADANEEAIGISDGSTADYTSNNHAVSGDLIRLQPGHILYVECGGTVAGGANAKSDADGKAVAVATTGTTEQHQLVKLIEDGADGKIVRCIWAPKRFHPETT